LFRRLDPTKHWPEKFNEFSYRALAQDVQAEHRKQAIEPVLTRSSPTKTAVFYCPADEPKPYHDRLNAVQL